MSEQLFRKADNPRGYAFVALHNAWERMFTWDWFAAMNAANLLPPKWEWIEDGLRAFDSLMLDTGADEREVTDRVVSTLQKSLRASANGALSFKGHREGVDAAPRYTFPGADGLAAMMPAATEVGYRAVEDRDELVRVLNGVRPRLTRKQREVLDLWLSFDGDISHQEMSGVLGVSRSMVTHHWRRITTAAKQELLV